MGSCRYFFCLMHVGTRYQHYQRGTPDTFSRLRNFSGSHDLDYQRLPACHCHLFAFSSLGEIYGYRKIFLSGIAMFIVTSLICALSHSFWTLTIARIFQGFSASAITSVNTAQLRTIYPRKQIGRGMGINAMVVASSRPLGSQRNSICRFLALAIRYQRPSRISCPDFGIKVPAPKRGTFKQTIRQAECHSQCNHLRTPDLYFGWICPPRKQ